MEQQKDKVVELANKLIEIVDDKNGWESDSQKLGYIKAYLCGLTDGFDYCVEKIESLSSVRLEPMVSGEIPSDACFNAQPAKELFTCTQCGQKTTNPIYIKHPSAKNPYCEKCAKLAWRQAKDVERG